MWRLDVFKAKRYIRGLFPTVGTEHYDTGVTLRATSAHLAHPSYELDVFQEDLMELASRVSSTEHKVCLGVDANVQLDREWGSREEFFIVFLRNLHVGINNEHTHRNYGTGKLSQLDYLCWSSGWTKKKPSTPTSPPTTGATITQWWRP